VFEAPAVHPVHAAAQPLPARLALSVYVPHGMSESAGQSLSVEQSAVWLSVSVHVPGHEIPAGELVTEPVAGAVTVRVWL
jgi:hypothetical protein